MGMGGGPRIIGALFQDGIGDCQMLIAQQIAHKGQREQSLAVMQNISAQIAR